jgi:predicted nicotinamide N-methyase
MIGQSGAWDIVLVGDLFYERPLAEKLLDWLRTQNFTALLGDPSRSYFPKSGVEKLATYTVQTTRDLEDREIRETSVYRLVQPE